MKFSLEKMFQIWNDNTGERFEVKQDADSLSLIEVRLIDDNGKFVESVRGPAEQMELVAQAILELAKELKEKP